MFNRDGLLDVSSTRVACVVGIQAQLDAINNNTYGAISPWATNDFDKIGKILSSDPNG